MFRTIIAGSFALILAAGASGGALAGEHKHRKDHGAQVFLGILNGLAAAANTSAKARHPEPYAKKGHTGVYGRGRPSPPPAGGYLPGGPPAYGPSLHRKLAGNSVSGFLADGTHFCEYYDYSGQLRGVDRSYYTGSWSVSGNWLYYDYPGYEDDGRYRVADSKYPWVEFYDDYGRRSFHNTRLHNGNACGV